MAGNLLESTATGANQKLAYLDQGHIREVRDGADALLYRYYYDADGKRRIKAKAVSGNTSITANCSYYFYEGEDCQRSFKNGPIMVIKKCTTAWTDKGGGEKMRPPGSKSYSNGGSWVLSRSCQPRRR